MRFNADGITQDKRVDQIKHNEYSHYDGVLTCHISAKCVIHDRIEWGWIPLKQKKSNRESLLLLKWQTRIENKIKQLTRRSY